MFWLKQVYGDDALLGSFMSSGSTLDFENWTINADDVSSIRLEASGLGDSEWLSITEVRLCPRDTEISSTLRILYSEDSPRMPKRTVTSRDNESSEATLRGSSLCSLAFVESNAALTGTKWKHDILA